EGVRYRHGSPVRRGRADALPREGGIMSLDHEAQAKERAREYFRTNGTQLPVPVIRERIADAVRALDEFLVPLSAEQAARATVPGEWTIHEIVDHLIETYRPGLDELWCLLAGRRPPGEPIPAGLQSKAPLLRPWPWLRDELRRVHAEVLKTLADASRAWRREALWGLLGGKVVSSWGVQWDIQWHTVIGRDSFWIPPHVMTYAGVVVMVMLSFGVLAGMTLRPSWRVDDVVRVLGLAGTRGFHLAAGGIALTVLAAPIDDLWHRLFGIDVTLWSPPHLLGLLGAAINTLGCFVIAREVYPASSRAGFAALIFTGATLLIGLNFAMQPTFRFAYVYAGVLFHFYAMLAPLVLPIAFVATARLSGRRWAPALVLVSTVALGLLGMRIARLGFDVLQPVSFIQEEIAKDPT